MNYLWGGMIFVGVIYGAFNGTLPDVTEAAISSAKEAVSLAITMMGVMSFWVGMMRIAENAGIIGGITRRLQPVLHFMFPRIPKNHPANKHIATNMIANVFGLGWAATPAGLKAMEELANLEEERNGQKNKGIATREMCIFLIINISSLQLIPVNVIAYRSQYGSMDAASIIGPGLIATFVSTIGAIIFCKIMDKLSSRSA